MLSKFARRTALVTTLLFTGAHLLSAQDHGNMPGMPAATPAGAPEKDGASSDWRMEAMAKHMAYTAARPLTPADSLQSAKIVNDLRQAIAKYRDVRVAEADGYKMFAPQIKDQPQYHFTNGWNAIRNQFGFDPARPTSLLYKKNAKGEFELTGAMYTASKGTSEETLNERVPLSIAHWHRHVNWCVPRRLDKARWSETENGRPVFGPLGVATKDECDAAGGRFIPQAFGWMVHATVFSGNDLSSIWHDDHMEHDHAMLGDPKIPD